MGEQVQRYDFRGQLVRRGGGALVSHTDYATLEAECAKLSELLNAARGTENRIIRQKHELETQNVALREALDKYAPAIHYPEHWDTTAYPTLQSAIHEILTTFTCVCGGDL